MCYLVSRGACSTVNGRRAATEGAGEKKVVTLPLQVRLRLVELSAAREAFFPRFDYRLNPSAELRKMQRLN